MSFSSWASNPSIEPKSPLFEWKLSPQSLAAKTWGLVPSSKRHFREKTEARPRLKWTSNMAELRRWMDSRANPCRDEAAASMKCLDENNYVKSRCQEYFDAYKECKKAWNAWRAEQRKQGLPQYDGEYRYTKWSDGADGKRWSGRAVKRRNRDGHTGSNWLHLLRISTTGCSPQVVLKTRIYCPVQLSQRPRVFLRSCKALALEPKTPLRKTLVFITSYFNKKTDGINE